MHEITWPDVGQPNRYHDQSRLGSDQCFLLRRCPQLTAFADCALILLDPLREPTWVDLREKQARSLFRLSSDVIRLLSSAEEQ